MYAVFDVLTCGVPTFATGRIYSRKVMEDAISKYLLIPRASRLGTVICTGETVDMSQVSHLVHSIGFVGIGTVVVQVNFLENIRGKTLHKLYKFSPDSLQLAFAGLGTLDKNNVVSDYEILYTHFIKNNKKEN